MLAQSPYVRFIVAPSNGECEEGMGILETILTFHGYGDGPSPYKEEEALARLPCSPTLEFACRGSQGSWSMRSTVA